MGNGARGGAFSRYRRTLHERGSDGGRVVDDGKETTRTRPTSARCRFLPLFSRTETVVKKKKARGTKRAARGLTMALVVACFCCFALSVPLRRGPMRRSPRPPARPVRSHRWPNATIDVGPVAAALETLDRRAAYAFGAGGGAAATTNDGAGLSGSVLPYFVRSGQLYRSRALLGVGRARNKRVEAFEWMASEALRIAAIAARGGGGGESVRRDDESESSGARDDGSVDRERYRRLISDEESFPFLLNYGDYYKCNSDEGYLPQFTWTAVADLDLCNASFAIPGYNLWNDRGGRCMRDRKDWQRTHRWYNEVLYPWGRKVKKAVWRGSPTGRSVSDGASWKLKPRSKFVTIGLRYPNLFDVGFHSVTAAVVPIPEERREMTNAPGYLKEKMNSESFMKYRVVIDIDGNSWSSRFGSLLCMNSLVVKVESHYSNWFDSTLRPWVHYVPVRADLSDLVNMVSLATSNDREKEMKIIVRNANEWCAEHITRDAMARDFLETLISYHELLIAGGKSKGKNNNDEEDENKEWGKVRKRSNAAYERQHLDMMPVGNSRLADNVREALYCPLETAVTLGRSMI